MTDVESQQREVQQHPNLHLSSEERRLFGQLFSAADTEKIGVVTGEVAVKFFEKTRLSPDVLGEIWQIADNENRGLLTPAGFGIVLRLIGYAQAGQPVSAELALKPGGPLPKFDGITPSAGPPPQPQVQAQAQPLQAQNSGPIRVPPLTPDKVAQYSSLFEESGAQNGMLSGETAKQIFERAKLPIDVLGRIWNLADRDQNGHLGMTEFIIAMHLLASYKNGSMRALPQILPSGLYEAAARRGVARQVTGSRPTSDGVSGSALPRQFNSTGYPAQAPPTARPQQATSTGDQWAVSPQDKAQFDQIYATVDTQNRGYITGEQAVGFFSNSRLPEDALAQIWDLADINSEGQLNRDEFAVAMYLIKQQRSKRDGRDILPQSLPANLIPPSMRRQPMAPQQPTAPAFDNAANINAPKSASEDLFGLDAFSAPSSPPISPQTKATGDSAYAATPPRDTSSPVPQPFQQQQSHPQSFPQQQSHFKPFVPSSSFGQAMMTPQGTGTSASTNSPVVQNRGLPQQQQKQPSAMDDLLGDNDPEVSKRLTNETSELANLSNQVSSLTGQMQDIKTKRGSTEQDLSQAQSQKRDFEGRLTQLRSAYEQEVREVQALEERLRGSKSETQKLQQDMSMVQGTHEDLQNQHRQISEALSLDQNENANLKERIRQTNAEISDMKPQLEKMRSDARQQKGLVAINKKQLATNEAELEKAKADLEAAAREHEEAARELEQSKRDLEASSQAVSQAKSQVRNPPAAVASPPSSTASMNPFFRRSSNATTEKGMSPFQTQTVASPNHNAFDSFFGPSLGSSEQGSGPPPSTSFMNDPPNTHREEPEQPVASNQSRRSSYGPDVPTPSASPPPLSNFSDSPRTVSEPPAPPQSRQITSSFLPFRPNVERFDSNSPSVRANPPASRMGDRSEFEGSTGRQASTAEPSIPESPRQHFAEMAAKPPQAEASQFTPPSSQQTPTASSEGIRQQEAAIPDEMIESSRMPSATRGVPGAFPGDETPEPEPSFYSVTTPYSSSKLDPRVDSQTRGGFMGSTKEPSNTTSEGTQGGNDPFAVASEDARTPVTAKDDFDSAFSEFGDKGKAPEQRDRSITTNGFESAEAPKSHGEFPPIQEFGAEDESDSDEDRGFGDNFTAHSANRTAESGPNQALQAPPISEGLGMAPTRPPFSTTDTNTSQLPTPGAQTSPPTYDQTVGAPLDEAGHRKESNQFPAEYSGLLPSRVDPTSPTTSPPPQSAVVPPVASTAGIDRGLNFFGEDTTEQAAGHATIGSSFSHERSPMSPGASTAAPYAYNHTSSLPQQQSQTTYPPVPAKAPIHDDFDDEFGDLSEAKEASEKGDDDFSSSRHNDFEDFNPVFDSPAASRHTAQSSSTFPTNDSFADFESSITGTGSSSRQQQVVQQTPSHDWDAIFSGLDTPQNNGVQGGLDNDFPSPPRGQSGKAVEKPGLKRTMTEDTTTDDPILKELTGMGYPRGESLQALERFDYNLDKAADFLASKS